MINREECFLKKYNKINEKHNKDIKRSSSQPEHEFSLEQHDRIQTLARKRYVPLNLLFIFGQKHC